MSRNLRRLREKLRSKDCQFCSLSMLNNCLVIHDVDTNQYFAQCRHCMTVYNHNFNIEHLGVPGIIGVA
jgi:hypothetical protein